MPSYRVETEQKALLGGKVYRFLQHRFVIRCNLKRSLIKSKKMSWGLLLVFLRCKVTRNSALWCNDQAIGLLSSGRAYEEFTNGLDLCSPTQTIVVLRVVETRQKACVNAVFEFLVARYSLFLYRPQLSPERSSGRIVVLSCGVLCCPVNLCSVLLIGVKTNQ